jgi:tetraacyldisaccharide 4'-kinase
MKKLLTQLPTPGFWYGARGNAARLWPQVLSPLGALYAAAVRQRFAMHHPVPMDRPVICVGNVVAGGAGKTPVVIALVKLLQDEGRNPHILSRGYGGREEGPLQVSPPRDTADDVGDEPLLLVEAAPTWVSRSRALGVQAAIDTGATVVVMDDGYQNPSFYKDFSILVLDGPTGLGNGRVLPAGPLREHFDDALSRADAVIIVGEDKRGLGQEISSRRADLPVFGARLQPAPGAPDVGGESVYAFAGIARPDKFRHTLEQAGATVEGWAAFPDHYPYEAEDLAELTASAAARGVKVYTTVKDHVRLPAALQEKVEPFAVEVRFDDAPALAAHIGRILEQKRGNW